MLFTFFFIKNRLIAVCAIDFFALTYIKALIIVALIIILRDQNNIPFINFVIGFVENVNVS